MTVWNTPEELAKLQHESMSSAIRVAQLTVEASQKLLGVQWEAARQAVDAGSRNIQALAQVNSREAAMALRAKLAEQAVEQALDYSEKLYSVAAEVQAQFTDLVARGMDDRSAEMQSTMEKLLEATPSGAAAATAAVRSALAAGQAALDGMTRTSRQLSDIARAGIKASSREANELNAAMADEAEAQKR
ncbi:MAG: phasin family protein [Proteobacteria bacterium]|nr:phasin family protein [Burkholderiales bacterium]